MTLINLFLFHLLFHPYFCFFLLLSLSTTVACVLFWLVVCMLLSYWLSVISLSFLCSLNQVSAFVGRGRIASEERLVHLSFTYGVWRGLACNFLTFITSLFIYCDIWYSKIAHVRGRGKGQVVAHLSLIEKVRDSCNDKRNV